MTLFRIFAACFTTISAYHLQALVTVVSKHFALALNVASQNAVLYTSKLNILRFLFKILGCLIECILYGIALIISKRTYDDVLDKLATEISRNEIKIDELKEPVEEIVKTETKNADSIVEEIIKLIENNLDNIKLKDFETSIKSNSNIQTNDVKKYEETVEKLMVGTIEKERNTIKETLYKYVTKYKGEIIKHSKKCVNDILNFGEIKTAKEKGDSKLFDYPKIFDDILMEYCVEILKILSKKSTAEVKNQTDNTDIKSKIGNEYVDLLKKQIPIKLTKHSDAIKQKYGIIVMSSKIAEEIVEKTEEIKDEIEKKRDDILGNINHQKVKEIRDIIQKEDETIIKVIQEQAKKHKFELTIIEIILNAEKISEIILQIESIKSAIDKYAPSYTLIETVLEYTIKRNAEDISKNITNGDSSTITKLFGEGTAKDSKDLVKTLVKNMIAEIIIKNATEIAKKVNPLKNNIMNAIKQKIEGGEFKKKIQKVKKEIKIRDKILKTANSMAESIVKQQDISQRIENSASIFGREVKELNGKIAQVTKGAIEDLIKEYASGMAKNEQFQLIKDYGVFRIKDEINGKLAINKDNVAIMKAKWAAPECRKIVSIIALAAMLATRIILLCMVHKSTNLGYRAYIIMIVESLFLGMFQTSLLSLAADQSATIRLSIELSKGLAVLVQTVLTKLFYKNDQNAMIVQVLIVCVLNFLGIIIWICCLYADSNKTKNKGVNTPQNDKCYKGTIWSPYLMFFFASLFREFLYPNIVPNALIAVEKSLMRSILLPLFIIGGIISAVLIELNGGCDPTYWEVSDVFWAFLGPQIGVCVVTLMAIHTKGCMAMYILENKPFVIFFCFGLLFCHSIMMTVSYLGVADYVEKTREYFNGYIESHSILCDVFVFFVSKLSWGYDKVRREYGLGVNVIITDAIDQPKPVVFVRECLTSAWTDIAKDFKTRISDCL